MANSTKCGPGELGKVFANAVVSYNQDIADGIKTDVKNVAKECVKNIKKLARKKTGVYRRSWTTKTEFESKSDIRIIVHAGKEYPLTHLLENGHQIIRGNTKVGEAPPYPHIEPAEKDAEKKLLQKVKIRVKK